RRLRGRRRRVSAAPLRAYLFRVGATPRAKPRGRDRFGGGQALPYLADLSRGLRARLRARVDEHLPGARAQGRCKPEPAAAYPRVHVPRFVAVSESPAIR